MKKLKKAAKVARLKPHHPHLHSFPPSRSTTHYTIRPPLAPPPSSPSPLQDEATPEDTVRLVEDNIQELTDAGVAALDVLLQSKVEELS